MSLSPKEVKRDLEAENNKEDDWEVVSGMKSLPVEAPTGSGNSKEKMKQTSMEYKDNPVKELEKKVDELEDVKTNEGTEKEADDWYHTIPPTPMNTPEFTLTPPSYPSTNKKSETQKGLEGTELDPITEEILDDQTHQDEGSGSYDDQGDLQNQTSNNLVKKSIDIIIYSLSRLAIFVIVFSVLKWLFTKACQKIRSIKATRSESK